MQQQTVDYYEFGFGSVISAHNHDDDESLRLVLLMMIMSMIVTL